MSVTKVGVVYSPSQKIRRRVIILNHKGAHDNEFARHIFSMAKGEEWLEIPLDLYNSFGSTARDHEIGNTVDVHIASVLGNPESDRCAVVDEKGNVVHVLCADPGIDRHPAGELIAHPEVNLDWKYSRVSTYGYWIKPPDPIYEPYVEPALNTVTFHPEEKASTVPLGSLGARWQVCAKDKNLSVGCETHPIAEWRKFKVSRVALMDEGAGDWWKNFKDDVMAFCDEHLARIAGAK